MMLASGLLEMQIATTVFIFLGTFTAFAMGYEPMRSVIGWQMAQFDRVLRKQLLMTVTPRAAMTVTICGVVLFSLVGYLMGGWVATILCMVASAFAPYLVLTVLRSRHLAKLEMQLVPGVQTIASGVRAGLNLVQAMELVAKDAAEPMRSEFAHMLQEYEFGMGLEDAMAKASERIGSSDYRLLFSALLTHRQRGGDLGETLDRISESIREIQRLEKQVIALTAQGRATARMMGILPMVVLLIMYFLISPEQVTALFTETLGRIMLLIMATLNLIGFLWVRKIMQVDI
jgi:tight adherence protein B